MYIFILFVIVITIFLHNRKTNRKRVVRRIKKKGEDSKVAIRSIRRDAMDAFKLDKKNGEITEDDLKGIEADVQKVTDKFIKNIDDIIVKKEKEIMEV